MAHTTTHTTGSRLGQQFDESASECCETGFVSRCVQDWPDQAVLISLVGGLGVGLLIGTALSQAAEERSRYDRRVAEGLGRRLMASLDRMVPETISRSFGIGG